MSEQAEIPENGGEVTSEKSERIARGLALEAIYVAMWDRCNCWRSA